jgi:chemotaxis protein MotB
MALVMMLFLPSCVSKKKYAALEADYENCTRALDETRKLMKDCDEERKSIANQMKIKEGEWMNKEKELSGKVNRLEEELDFQRKNNTNLLARLEDLSILTRTEAENVRRSLDQLNEQSRYIKDMTKALQRKDSLNMALVMNLKRSLSDVNDEDVKVEVKKGVVYISLSDKMLFRSGSARITAKADAILAKVAKVLNDQSEMEIMVEGHTDNVPIATDCIEDNWDLSVKRATSVVRTLQTKYKVEPQRMSAAGRSEFLAKDTNKTAEGRSNNRRTEIIIVPKLDQFFNLMAEASAQK